MFRRIVTHVSQVLGAVMLLSPLVNGMVEPPEARHQFIRGVRDTFATEIKDHQKRLGTNYYAVALVDLAKKRLEKKVYLPTEPNWSLVIHYALLGYGFTQGVIDTSSLTGKEKPTETDMDILRQGYTLSSAYLKARNKNVPVQANQVFAPTLSRTALEKHVQALNQAATLVSRPMYNSLREFCQKVSLIESLSEGIPEAERLIIGNSVDLLPKEHYTQAFAVACNTLTAGEDVYVKATLIPLVAEVAAEHQQQFARAGRDLMEGMETADKVRAIRAFVSVPADHYTSAFTTVCKTLLTGITSSISSFIIRLGALPMTSFTPTAIATYNRLGAGLDGLKKVQVMKIIASVPEAKHQALIKAYSALGGKMDHYTQIRVIGLLAALMIEMDSREIETMSMACNKKRNLTNKIQLFEVLSQSLK